MSLSTKHRADYIELINQALDTIPIFKPADFEVAVRNLEKFLQENISREVPPGFDSELKDPMKEIWELYTQKDYDTQEEIRYVESPDNDAEYQQIIKDRIQAKITEFNSFTPAQKHQYITNQKTLRDQALHHQVKANPINVDERRAANARVMEAESRAEHESTLQQQRAIEEQIQRDRRSREARSRMLVFDATGNIYLFVCGGRLLSERALQLTPEQRNLLNNLNPNGEPHYSMQTGRVSVDEVLERLERDHAQQAQGRIGLLAPPSMRPRTPTAMATTPAFFRPNEQSSALSSQDIRLITNTDELQNIFQTTLRDATARQILSFLIDAEMDAGSSSRSSSPSVD